MHAGTMLFFVEGREPYARGGGGRGEGVKTARYCPEDGLQQPHNPDVAGMRVRDKYSKATAHPGALRTELGLPPSGIARHRHS